MMSSERKKELIREYKLRPKPAGIFQIKNTVNGKLLLGSSKNLDGVLNKHQFALSIGTHRNMALQRDWKEYGERAFVFEILDKVKVKEEPGFNLDNELLFLEELWIEKLNPFDGQGYNTSSNLRHV